MTSLHFLSDHLEVCTIDATGRTNKRKIDNLWCQSDDFEYLRTLVRLQRRYTHLTHDFQNTLA